MSQARVAGTRPGPHVSPGCVSRCFKEHERALDLVSSGLCSWASSPVGLLLSFLQLSALPLRCSDLPPPPPPPSLLPGLASPLLGFCGLSWAARRCPWWQVPQACVATAAWLPVLCWWSGPRDGAAPGGVGHGDGAAQVEGGGARDGAAHVERGAGMELPQVEQGPGMELPNGEEVRQAPVMQPRLLVGHF